MPSPPDHRARRVIELAATATDYDGDHPVERDFFYLVKSGETTIPDVAVAYEIYQEPEDRHVFDALILARADDVLIADALRCPPSLLPTYRHLFCDVAVFRHTPAVFRYIRELPLDEDEQAWRQYYLVATQQGPEYLANRFRVGVRPDVEPRKVLKTAVADMFDRFLAHRGQQLDSAIAQQALRWGNSAVTAAQVLIEKGGDTKKNAMEELRVALETVDHTSTPEDAGINPDDVLT